MSFAIITLTPEEQKSLHWDGILAVLSGQYKTLQEAKKVLEKKKIFDKSGLQEPLKTAFSQDASLFEMWVAMQTGGLWGDLWWDSTHQDLQDTQKKLKSIYLQLALEPEGRWRLGAERIRLEERCAALQKELGY